MTLDPYYWRPITFEGESLSPALMALSVLASIFGDAELTPGDDDDEFYFWLKGFGICCGRTKTAPAEACRHFAERAAFLLQRNWDLVITEIQQRLADQGFEPEATAEIWLSGLRKISELTQGVHHRECEWSAPLHSRDSFKPCDDGRRFLDLFASNSQRKNVHLE